MSGNYGIFNDDSQNVDFLIIILLARLILAFISRI